MNTAGEQAVIDFYRYPSVGAEDWRYGFATAKVRVLESMMLGRNAFLDMTNAEKFETAVEMLSGSEYAVPAGTIFSDIESMLLEKRSEVRKLFTELMLDEELAEILRAREDFANMRLAVRRVVTEKPIGLDYSDDGSVPAEEFEEIFEQENYSRFPEYLQDAVEQAVLGYYENKDIRQIDYGIDRVQAAYKLDRAIDLGSVFLQSLFRTQIDLNNIRTMLRLKLAERDDRNLFIEDGFVETERFIHGLDIGYEALGPLFYATPYHGVVEGGVGYLTREKSFLHLEKDCEDHLMGFLRTTGSLASGPQPVIAYLMMKENEIRTVRMVLTGKKNNLETKLLLERLGEWN